MNMGKLDLGIDKIDFFVLEGKRKQEDNLAFVLLYTRTHIHKRVYTHINDIFIRC